MNRRFFILILLLAGYTGSASLWAHPHMWIRGRIVPVLGGRGLESVHVVWDMDGLSSAALILDFDTDKNGSLSPAEIEKVRTGAFEHLIDYEYYLLVEVGNLLATPGPARDFTARIVDGRLIYDFHVPLKIPIRWDDMTDVKIFLFDSSYFIDFRPDDIRDTEVSHLGRVVEFRRSQTRSMTMGYGMVNLTGLSVTSVSGG